MKIVCLLIFLLGSASSVIKLTNHFHSNQNERRLTETEHEFNDLYETVQLANLKLMSIDTDLSSFENEMNQRYETSLHLMHEFNEDVSKHLLSFQSELLGADGKKSQDKNNEATKNLNLELPQIVEQFQKHLETKVEESKIKYQNALDDFNRLVEKINERPKDDKPIKQEEEKTETIIGTGERKLEAEINPKPSKHDDLAQKVTNGNRAEKENAVIIDNFAQMNIERAKLGSRKLLDEPKNLMQRESNKNEVKVSTTIASQNKKDPQNGLPYQIDHQTRQNAATMKYTSEKPKSYVHSQTDKDLEGPFERKPNNLV